MSQEEGGSAGREAHGDPRYNRPEFSVPPHVYVLQSPLMHFVDPVLRVEIKSCPQGWRFLCSSGRSVLVRDNQAVRKEGSLILIGWSLVEYVILLEVAQNRWHWLQVHIIHRYNRDKSRH